MFDVLECMPTLENLTLKGTDDMDDEDVPFRVRKHRKVPKCLTSSLKMVSVEKFSGRRDQVAMLGHILQNASLLQTMTVMTGNMDIDAKYNFIRQLSKFRRSSVMCTIEFS
ncbi:hypothetical protein LIER_30138 [Lithospermum erythrorhizon]|uniref:FBD domain-containing protein n=1 Tax=Lithospermum erythrorhizon TaxID=34254 RepID=A0AAV3RRV4_LITER